MRKRKDHRGSEGSVLMETIIAIPLYMVLLGGIFWLGDLMITRQQLVVADRYIAWNKGMRHADRGRIDNAAIHTLFFADADGNPSSYHKPISCNGRIDEEYDWSHKASGQARFEQRMPEWTRYMFNAAQVMYDTGVPFEESGMQGRDKPDQRHVVVMRSEKMARQEYIRNRYGVDNSGRVAERWRQIGDERWPYE